ncbi:MAG TPA: hypothetical protein VG389_27465 [Myxococcota bacterium]|jgi:hypothetical protein|nr:hypothetical protein [Myxococcota bacterium]
MNLSGTAVMLVEFYGSLLSFGLIAAIYVVPAMRRLDFREVVTPILLMHSFRHVGLIYLLFQVVPEVPPPSFAVPTAWGDALTAGLALVALVAVRRRWTGATAAVWLFNVVGSLDLAVATYASTKVDLMKYRIGPAYFLPAIVVPALLVTHALVFWLLIKRPGPRVRAALSDETNQPAKPRA